MEYRIVLTEEADGRFSASAPELPGCFSWGETREEALERMKEAIDVWIESATADGLHYETRS